MKYDTAVMFIAGALLITDSFVNPGNQFAESMIGGFLIGTAVVNILKLTKYDR